MKSIVEYKGKKIEVVLPYRMELISKARKELGEAGVVDGVWNQLHEELHDFYQTSAAFHFEISLKFMPDGEFFNPDKSMDALDYVVF